MYDDYNIYTDVSAQLADIGPVRFLYLIQEASECLFCITCDLITGDLTTYKTTYASECLPSWWTVA